MGNLPADLDRHQLVGTFGTCRVHWDLGYLAIADQADAPTLSDESEAVAWWPVDQLQAAEPQLWARLDLLLEQAN